MLGQSDKDTSVSDTAFHSGLIKEAFIDGLRVTDEATMEVAEMRFTLVAHGGAAGALDLGRKSWAHV